MKKKPTYELPAYIKRGDARGMSKKLSDRAFWLADEYDLPTLPDPLIDLLAEIDKTKDPMPLLGLLESLGLPKAALPHFRDLFDRWKFAPRNRHSRRPPSYQLTDNQIQLRMAVEQVRSAVKRGASLEDAKTEAEQFWRLDSTALTAALANDHRSLRDANKK
jgi:hypothetical protein